MIVEVWKPIVNYEGLYEVSNLGNVRGVDRLDPIGRISRGKIFSTKATKNYITVRLSKCGNIKTFRIHRLVAEAFIPNPDGKPCVNHIDGNKQNNHVSNLEWCSYSENMKHAYKNGLCEPQRKLTDEDIQEIISQKGKVSCKALSKKYNVSFQLICEIWKGGGRQCK